MQSLATAKLSSKGQIVIPEDVRKRLGLQAGDRFVVVGEGDVVILKTIRQPSMKEFDALIKKARNQAQTAGMKRKDVEKAIARARDKNARRS